ncbi:MarR family winged helix-turn-helix transcriptional regulator [Anaerobranca gottschalkii]|uniref:DNA-binding transcriptional regulator, MarR family n=1 Tax=Anaerobranca gottschalkii DSM 13577 TaxID=1120990 RepID=A0A1I0AFU1_9FIRM|nr:MarR family transcriptional regulator [Anaerobranca gottschalkii]SES92994.1 DNA-binding transcriptional regulator, MarR family [Anaerobranca gottschalkii DSM 13577]
MEDKKYSQYVEEIETLIRKVSFVIKCRGRDILSNFDITPPQFNALLLLYEYGDMTIGELGNRMYLASSTATDLIDRMERNGLVERVRDEKDRRVVRLHMTEKGQQMILEVLESRKRYLDELLTKVNIEDQEKLVSSLSKIYDLMKDEYTHKL